MHDSSPSSSYVLKMIEAIDGLNQQNEGMYKLRIQLHSLLMVVIALTQILLEVTSQSGVYFNSSMKRN